MAVLTLNIGTGSPVDVPVASGGEIEPTPIGEAARSANGTLRDGVRALKRAWRWQSAELTAAQYTAIKAAIGAFNIIPCGGDGFQGVTTTCRVSYSEAPLGTIAIAVGGYKYNVTMNILCEEQ